MGALATLLQHGLTATNGVIAVDILNQILPGLPQLYLRVVLLE